MSTVSNYMRQLVVEPLKPGVKTVMDAIASLALASRYCEYLQGEHVPYLKTQLPDISDSTLLVASIGRDLMDENLYGDIGLKHIPALLLMKCWGTLDRWANNQSYMMVKREHVNKSVLLESIKSEARQMSEANSSASANGA